MRAAQIAVLLSASVLGTTAVHAATVRKVVGQQVFVKKGRTLHKTFLFGALPEGLSLKVVKQNATGHWVELPKAGTYRMTNDAVEARWGLRGKKWVGNKIVVEKIDPHAIF